jgi:ABC-2 type transport system permease protein/oleandomycin transport system permease protein
VTGPTRAATDTLAVTRRNLWHFARQPDLLIFSTVQPVMFVLLFAYVFGGAIESSLAPGLDYVDYLLPGILVQSVAFRSSQTAVGLAEDLRRGVMDRFRSMPMSRVAVLAGRTGADLVRNAVIVAIMVAVGYLIGFRFGEGVLPALGAVGLILLFGYALSWVFAAIAFVTEGAESAQSAGFVAIFPLVFASSVFVPVETMPSWLRWFAEHSPVSTTADAARGLSLGGAVAWPALQSVLWSLGILAVFATAAVWRFRRLG